MERHVKSQATSPLAIARVSLTRLGLGLGLAMSASSATADPPPCAVSECVVNVDTCVDGDNTGPVFTEPDFISGLVSNPTVFCGAAIPTSDDFAVNPTDPSDIFCVAHFDDAPIPGGCVDDFHTQTVLRTWIAIDTCCNETQFLQTIEPIGVSPLQVDGADTFTVECGEDLPPPPVILDPCGSSLSFSFNQCADVACDNECDFFSCGDAPFGDLCNIHCETTTLGTCPGTYTRQIVVDAFDQCLGHVMATQTVGVVDTTGPVIALGPPITVTDVNCNGSETVTLPDTADDACSGPVAVTNNAPASFPAGQTTAVTFSATDGCDNTAEAGPLNVTVEYGATIRVTARQITVGIGWNPTVTIEPMVGLTVNAYRLAPGSCARQNTQLPVPVLFSDFDNIFDNCTPTSSGVTDSAGVALIDVPPGNHVVIAKFDSNGDNVPDDFVGRVANNVTCGEVQNELLFTIRITFNPFRPGRFTFLGGSELYIIEPEYVLWDGTEQQYPFVFQSVGEWDVTATVEPPDGFVADYDSLSTDVNNEVDALQFTITEVGSDLVPTKTTFDVVHNGRRRTVRSSVDIRLTPDYARSRGFDVDELRRRGLIKEPDLPVLQPK